MKKRLLKIIYKILSLFIRFYIYRNKPYVIGITGSVGKTSCRMIVYQILKKYLVDKKIYTSPKNFNSELGTMFSILKIEEFKPGIINLFKLSFVIIFKSLFSSKSYDIIILEYGIDTPGDMDFLLSMVKPDISVFTKLDSIHEQNFESKNAIGEEKFKLILDTKKKTYLNYDDKFIKSKFDSLKIQKKYFNKLELSFEYIKTNNIISSQINLEDKIVKTNILGKENFVYIDLGFKILLDLGVNIYGEQYIELINQKGRFNILSGIKNSILVDSSYNAGPKSMRMMVENTIDIKNILYPDNKLLFILGDMRELGKISECEHKKLADYMENKGLIITIGSKMKKSFGFKIPNFKYSIKAGYYLKKLLLNNEEKYIILFKGSQNTIFCEEALKQLLKDKDDELNLVRQDDYWMNKKNNYFSR